MAQPKTNTVFHWCQERGPLDATVLGQSEEILLAFAQSSMIILKV
jgi:hypothetical protein